MPLAVSGIPARGPLRNGIVNTFWPIGKGGDSPLATFVPAIAYCDGHI